MKLWGNLQILRLRGPRSSHVPARPVHFFSPSVFPIPIVNRKGLVNGFALRCVTRDAEPQAPRTGRRALLHAGL